MHDPNDPFDGSDDDRTVIRPNPGRRSSPQGNQPSVGQYQSAAPPPPPSSSQSTGPSFEIGDISGLNPLEECATLMLNLLGQIRNTSSHPNPNALHQQLSGEIKNFERRAQQKGIPPETIFTARYILCTIVDEFVLSTPWGSSSIWSNQSLLRIFHQETSGGEKFFLLLDKLIHDPGKNIDLLELMYICLALGFQGKYRVMNDGVNSLESIRENLYRTIRNYRGDIETGLSPHWEGVDKGLVNKSAGIPLWAVTAIAFAIIAAAYIAFVFKLSRDAEPLYVSLSTAGMEENLVPGRALSPEPVRRISDPTPDRFSLKVFLEPEISRDQVTVDEQPEKIVVKIHGDGLFPSGSDVVKPDFIPILDRIAEGLAKSTGRVVVTGHSDNVPIATARFPSNRALSQARADQVVRQLAQRMADPNRLSAMGLADTQPIASNDTPQGRAQNRRVEITLLERSRSN